MIDSSRGVCGCVQLKGSPSKQELSDISTEALDASVSELVSERNTILCERVRERASERARERERERESGRERERERDRARERVDCMKKNTKAQLPTFSRAPRQYSPLSHTPTHTHTHIHTHTHATHTHTHTHTPEPHVNTDAYTNTLESSYAYLYV